MNQEKHKKGGNMKFSRQHKHLKNALTQSAQCFEVIRNFDSIFNSEWTLVPNWYQTSAIGLLKTDKCDNSDIIEMYYNCFTANKI